MTHTDGIYGGRFSGAGFKGCCMALIDPSFEESITLQVTENYLDEFPQLKGKFSVHICDSADGLLKEKTMFFYEFTRFLIRRRVIFFEYTAMKMLTLGRCLPVYPDGADFFIAMKNFFHRDRKSVVSR